MAKKKAAAKKRAVKKKAVKRRSAKKQPRKKRATAGTNHAPPKTANSVNGAGVTVRMFCHGLGDCFLITIPQADDRPYAILIDCGVAKGTTGQTELMKTVVNKIVDLTADPHAQDADAKSIIDLLIVTHEHLDHVSGFSQAEEIFSSRIEFRNIWFAWTENRRDKLAQELRDRYSKAKLALSNVRARLAKVKGDSRRTKSRLLHLDGVMAFGDLLPADSPLGAAAREGDLERGMKNLRSWAQELNSEEVLYLKPGRCLALTGTAVDGMEAGVVAY
jgi:hypothetical protein